jgi:hypothetical protein
MVRRHPAPHQGVSLPGLVPHKRAEDLKTGTPRE